MSELLLESREGALLLLTLNDPGRANALSAALAEDLVKALVRARGDDGVRAVILCGAGRHFSAGADLKALETIADGGDAEANLRDSRRLEELFAELLDHPKLTIAAVQGAAVAGGCGLATACDLVVAEAGARFSYTEVRIGFIPALVSTFLTRRVAGHVARRLMLDPEMLDAEGPGTWALWTRWSMVVRPSTAPASGRWPLPARPRRRRWLPPSGSSTPPSAWAGARPWPLPPRPTPSSASTPSAATGCAPSSRPRRPRTGSTVKG